MSYLVLARKWRPRRFAELVGQEHVVRALTNALASGRVHHAFLLTGTRGVGKTTIARIFAKSLNCERSAGAEPCGECGACSEIDAGRYVDLLEIDAASNTGVDDVREVIENAQYMPSRGKYKVYLVDEVHMLSKNAFNALLKTLEEPPAHVKFLLATTDPQKLPVTVLSRCLQFNLKRLDETQIRGQMLKILAAESLSADPAAIALLAHGADGSLRDGLSLLDQAIAYTGGDLDVAGVRAMLGTVDHAQVGGLLDALADGDGMTLLQRVDALAGFAPDFGGVLDDVASALHRVQLHQLVPSMAAAAEADAGLDPAALAPRLSPDVVHLWYQMAISGRRDLGLAPSPRAGFEMALLRMLAFRPIDAVASTTSGPSAATAGVRTAAHSALSRPGAASRDGQGAVSPSRTEPPGHAPFDPRLDTAGAAASTPSLDVVDGMREARPPSALAAPVHEPAARERAVHERAVHERAVLRQSPHEPPAQEHGAQEPTSPSAPIRHSSSPATWDEADRSLLAQSHAIEPPLTLAVPAQATSMSTLANADDWAALIGACTLRGPVLQLASHAAFAGYANGVLRLSLPSSDDHLCSENLVRQLSQALAGPLGIAPRVEFVAGAAGLDTLHARGERERDARQSHAESAFLDEPVVQRLMQHYGARVVPGSIQPPPHRSKDEN